MTKSTLRGKTHFDVESDQWTPTMMLRYIEFQESYNRSGIPLLEEDLLRFAWLNENEKQRKVFSKVYKKYQIQLNKNNK
jgi:hypothetical protein